DQNRQGLDCGGAGERRGRHDVGRGELVGSPGIVEHRADAGPPGAEIRRDFAQCPCPFLTPNERVPSSKVNLPTKFNLRIFESEGRRCLLNLYARPDWLPARQRSPWWHPRSPAA